MKKTIIPAAARTLALTAALLLTPAAWAQTLNITVGQVTYQFPANLAGEMTYTGGSALTVMGKTFQLTDISSMKVDNTAVTGNLVSVAYSGTSATVTVSGNVARYVEPTVSGAYVSIEQSNTDAVDGDEITYQLSGTTTDGQFALSGSYKCTIALDGLTLTCASDAAISIANGKRIQLSAKKGTVSTLSDCANGGQKACIYSKGQLQLQGNGTLNVKGNTKHAIKSGDYITVKNLTLNVTGAVGDGISCNEYFQMKSGTLSVSGVGDDGIQCDLDGTTSTGETTDHEDEDSGNIYIEDGNLTVSCTGQGTKGIKAGGDLKVTGGTLSVTTSGNGYYDTTDADAKGCACLKSDGNMTISNGVLTLRSTGTGGKAIKADGTLTIEGGTLSATATGSQYKYSSKATASAKGIKADGALTIAGGTVTASSASHEGIESKSTLSITGGYVYATGGDDAINSTGDMYLKGGYVFGRSTGTGTGADGIDANGNMYVQGATAYSIAHGSPDVAFDANTEGGKKLYVQSGNLVAIGGLESGASLTQSCYQASTYSKGAWYGLYSNGTLVLAFQVPSSGTMGTPMVVSTAGTATLKSGITVTNGTKLWDGFGYTDATVTGGSSVTLSAYSGGNSGPGGGGRPGGGR